MQFSQTNIIVTVFILTFVVLFVLAGFIFLVMHYRKKYNVFSSEKAAMYQQFKETLLNAQLEIQEQTLNHISEEIHDNIGQELGVVKIHLNILEQLQTFNADMLKEAMKNLDSAIVSLREVAGGMNTTLVQNFSLEENIQNLCLRINRTNALKILMETTGERKSIQGSTGLITFRIVQECVQNICKHAKTNRAWIKIIYNTDVFEVSVRDNGVGFNMDDEKKRRKGLGLQNIVNRATVLRGGASIESAVNKGTFIKLIMPYG